MPQRLDFAQWDLVNVPIGRKKLGIIDGTTGSGGGAGTGFTTAPAGGSNIVGILGTNGLALNVPAYLTTALGTNASSAFAGTGTSATNASITLNTAGLAISVAPPVGGGAGTGFTSASTAGANIVGTLDTNGLSVGVPAYLTTAQPPGAYLTTAQPPGAYLTTAMQSDASSAFAGTGATIAGGSMTVNTAGVNISLPAYLTTAQAPGAYLTTAALSQDSSKYAGTSTGIAGGSITLNTAGISLSLPAYLTTALTNIKVSAGTLSQLRSDLTFANSNSVSFGLNTNGVITASVNPDAAIQLSAGSTSTERQDFSFLNSNSVSFGLGTGTAAGHLTASIPAFAATNITSDRAGTNTSVVTTAGTDLSFAVNTSGVTIAYPKWLTAAAGGGAGTNTSVATTGGTDLTLGVNTSGVTIGYPKWITTAITNINVSASGGSSNLSALTFANSNNITFGLAAGVITASYSDADVFAGTNTSVVTTGGTDLSMALNSSGLTVAYPKWITTYVNDLTSQRAGTGTTLATTAGTDLKVTLNTDGLNISYPKWLTTAAAAPATQSYWGNMPSLNAMVTGASAITQTSGSSIFVQPFFLPYPVSVGFVRFLASFNDSAVGTAGTTQANTTFSCKRFTTYGVVVYSQGSGANSRSIQSVTSSSGGFTGMTQFGAAAQASRYTVTLEKTYPVSGLTSQYTTSFAVSSGSIVVSSNSNTLFTGPRFLDVPFGVSLPAGNYWLGLGASTSSASQSSNISFCGTAGLALSIAGRSQSDVSVGALGVATLASDNQMQIGLGVWSTNASNWSTGSIGVNSISQVVSNPQMPFWFIRQA